jgi:hypothetical protein
MRRATPVEFPPPINRSDDAGALLKQLSCKLQNVLSNLRQSYPFDEDFRCIWC